MNDVELFPRSVRDFMFGSSYHLLHKQAFVWRVTMIEDDPELGQQEDYIGPGVFVSLAFIVSALVVGVWFFSKLLGGWQ